METVHLSILHPLSLWILHPLPLLLPLFLLLKCLPEGTPGYGPSAQCSGAGPAHDACSLVLAPAPLRTGCSGEAFEAALSNLNTPEEGFNFDCRAVSCWKSGREETSGIWCSRSVCWALKYTALQYQFILIYHRIIVISTIIQNIQKHYTMFCLRHNLKPESSHPLALYTGWELFLIMPSFSPL